ncbi:MAG: BlaI/MecI/CopY family transcriptional regulator [Thermaerobacter sp.]|nr:BlaI/MecI/CopY family transcriptional regulator [Thermaerobacter sp.]
MERGGLRQQVLWFVRSRGSASAAEICEYLRQKREISLTAVQTVLARLVNQGLLTRVGTRRHYIYQALPTAAVVKARASRAGVEFLTESGEAGLVHFVEALETLQPGVLDKLERLLVARRAEEGKP